MQSSVCEETFNCGKYNYSIVRNAISLHFIRMHTFVIPCRLFWIKACCSKGCILGGWIRLLGNCDWLEGSIPTLFIVILKKYNYTYSDDSCFHRTVQTVLLLRPCFSGLLLNRDCTAIAAPRGASTGLSLITRGTPNTLSVWCCSTGFLCRVWPLPNSLWILFGRGKKERCVE